MKTVFYCSDAVGWRTEAFPPAVHGSLLFCNLLGVTLEMLSIKKIANGYSIRIRHPSPTVMLLHDYY